MGGAGSVVELKVPNLEFRTAAVAERQSIALHKARATGTTGVTEADASEEPQRMNLYCLVACSAST